MPEPYSDEEPRRSVWARMRDRLWGAEADELEEEEAGSAAGPDARRRAAIRLDTARGVRVAVRLSASSFNDARMAADGLKGGHQQIVNLEAADPDLAERILDFLSGVTYALDGSVDRIGDKVYLFAPANVHVEVDGGPANLR
jgi:cell division inhibitor SepF